MVEQFVSALEAVGGKAYLPSTPAEVLDTVVRLIRAGALEHKNLEILAWDESEIPLDGLEDSLLAASIARLDTFVPADPAMRRARLDELERAAVGLTGALAGIADSGTLVLTSGAKRPRLASLLPPVHIAVLARSTLYRTMAAFIVAHPNEVREASNLVFITGPSRTADIEQTLTLGVHGPKEVHVVLVD